MGAMVPPSRKSCYNFRVTEINRVLDGDTIDVTIDLGFDLFKKERVRIAGVDTPEKRTRDLEEKALGLDATDWRIQLQEMKNSLLEQNLWVAWGSMAGFLVGSMLARILFP